MRIAPRNRRAVVEVQFNWIFILIVGAIILFFFINLSMKQKERSTAKLAVDLLQDLDLLIAGQSVSVGRSNVVPLPPVTLSFTCDAYTLLQRAKRIDHGIVFSPSEFTGPKLLTWTQDWRMPFRVANFVYLTSSAAQYYLVYYDDDEEMLGLIERILHELPQELAVQAIPSSQLPNLKPANNPLVRFAFFSSTQEPISVPERFQNVGGEISAVQVVVQPEEPDSIGGLLVFYKQSRTHREFEPLGSIESIGLSALYGALYTPDFAHYQCNIGKALRRLATVSEVYAHRTAELSDAVQENCKPFLAGQPFDALTEAAEDGLAELEQPGGLQGFLNALPLIIDDLQRRNEAAVITSCPTLY